MRLIDIFRTGDRLYAWLFSEGDGRNHFYECMFEPMIHIYASFRNLMNLKRILDSYRIESEFRRVLTLKGRVTALSIKTTTKEQRKLTKDIDRFCSYSYEIYNADIPLEELYMFVKDVFPGAHVEIEIGDKKITDMKTEEDPCDEYDMPRLRESELDITTSYSLKKDMDAELLDISFNKRTYKKAQASEKEMISAFVRDFQSADPDIILTCSGNLELPYLLNRIRRYYPGFSFSRLGHDSFRTGGRSYFTYGRTIYKQSAVYLKGRLHLERRGVMYGYWSLWHPFELGRMCRVTLQKINHRSAGYGVSNLQIYYAMKRGYMIPRRSSCVEVWKSGYDLFNADRGSLIFEPRIGYHNDIAEIDFTSLFPSIMIRYNISTETLFCSCCRDNKVPGLNINICRNRQGIIPEMLEPIVKKRAYYKSTGKQEHLNRADALKGILVTSFGYMGFRKSKLARIEAHQSIQAYAREILLKAAKIAEEEGFTVVHGIVDSLWVKKKGLTKDKIDSLTRRIESDLGLKIKLEGLYRWIVFLPSTQNPRVPVPTRYYGVFENGEIKCRGIEVRRHDTPDIIKDLQLRMIEELSKAADKKEFMEQLKKSLMNMNNTISRILRGYVSQEELVIRKGISKTGYNNYLAQSIIIGKLKKAGFEASPGNYIKYIIADKKSDIKDNRYSLESEKDFFLYDRYEYARLVKKAVQNILMPFIELIDEEIQPTLHGSIRKSRHLYIKDIPLRARIRI
jgi:DNA polymerase elongation subunit (family B)